MGSATTPSTPAAASAVPSNVPAASVPVVPLTTQVARTLFTLAGAAAGDHVMTIQVSPDNLGPVTVRAHLGADGIRVELFVPTDLARDALRAILPDLRRDLASGGLNVQLDLSNRDQASGDGAARQFAATPVRPAQAREPAEPAVFHAVRFSNSHTIDVLA
ncbi:flagellar hook-length control protein FliK [Cryobacterium sp. TmT2-59]|nr:flagellar hook-length control protein FliK [Cryobacterium sp. TmT2-59]